jgi:uncharacterized protein YdeI (BOF family)
MSFRSIRARVVISAAIGGLALMAASAGGASAATAGTSPAGSSGHRPAQATASAALSAAAAKTVLSKSSVVLSGTVLDYRGEQVHHGVITLPATTPTVQDAKIEVNGRVVDHSGRSGKFSFTDKDPSGRAVTVTVVAPGFGSYQLTGITPAQSGDALTVPLTRGHQSRSGHSAPVESPAPAPRARGVARPADASSSCGGYSSNTTQPSLIYVLEYSEHTS